MYILEKIKSLLSLETDFKLILDDPSGNSFIENPHMPSAGMYVFILKYSNVAY